MAIEIPRSTSTAAPAGTRTSEPTPRAATQPATGPAVRLNTADSFNATSARSGAGAAAQPQTGADDFTTAENAIKNATTFTRLDDGKQMNLSDAFSQNEINALKGIALQQLEALKNQQPPLSPDQIHAECAKALQKFATDCGFEKKMNDFFVDWIIQSMADARSKISEALSG